ncbi:MULTISPECIES: transcriptional regulator NrdR [Caldilinea]|jgi:transcriptional repressor NrdR|uniref:Transcriptional repressor NrdR n=1 Tax=Caldilinea aerophila TaxID=133453 RepID=A0A7C1FPH3_9CHLR|nr:MULTISPECIES: transcriptional regulator NrdR [Caldilinea]MBO9391820.1 transcriptional repressor NrdR [Caldilinea sp.]GIV73177.1 MAG: transcriptional repressor NrdR [Caldilinea sp.]
MRCPHCGHDSHRVIDTRNTGDAIRRRRQCEQCGQRFTTYEHVAANLLVIKSDGRREPFDRQKILSGIQIAATKRPITRETMEAMVDQITEALQAIGRTEVPSKLIGSMVLDQLAHVDQVAYIRFASVYLDINDLNELRNEIDRLMGRSTMTPEPV